MRPDVVTYSQLTGLTKAQGIEWSCAINPGVWAEWKLGFKNTQFHHEWYELEMRHSRLTVVAPREHAKSEVFSVNTTAHHAIYRPGCWQYLFSSTLDQSKLLLERCLSTIAQSAPYLLERTPRFSTTDVILSNWSRISVASVGKAIRGIHPDRLVGDDVLKEENTSTNLQRRRLEAWWFGTISPMAHPGATRPQRWGKMQPLGRVPVIWHPPTKVILVGTPFHQLDLLMGMKDNPIYTYRRYAAEFQFHELIPGTLAVEAVGGLPKVA